MSSINTSPANLKKHIRHLIDVIGYQENRLAIRKHCLTNLKPELDEVVNALTDDITALKHRGREAVFDLQISGISHREFMRFIEELNHD